MNYLHAEILLLASLSGIACTLPGTILVTRGTALLSDAISHAVLLGIAVMFLVVHSLDSFWLIVGASAAGIVSVLIVEKIIAWHYLKKDAAIGITFPLFFSLGVILISCYARNVHLDIDMVLLGELAFAPFNRWYVHGLDVGPWALWTLLTTIFFMGLMLTIWYKEWQLTVFDQQAAYLLGCSPKLLHYLLVTMTSITAVTAFNIVGSLMVIALMIIPPATAYLFSTRFSEMIFLSIGFSLASAWSGYALAIFLNASIAGCIAMAAGCLFCAALLITKDKRIS